MSSDQRFAILLVVLSCVMTGLMGMVKALFGVSKRWVQTAATLEGLSSSIKELIQQKERDHARLAKSDHLLDERIRWLERRRREADRDGR